MRKALLAAQKDALRAQGALAISFGFYGLSAGEGPNGVGYITNGVDDIQAEIIHPHYMVMTSTLKGKPSYAVFKRLESMSLFTPFGLVENFDFNLNHKLAMMSSLNASFEATNFFHMQAKRRRIPNNIYEASSSNALLQTGIRRFYP